MCVALERLYPKLVASVQEVPNIHALTKPVMAYRTMGVAVPVEQLELDVVDTAVQKSVHVQWLHHGVNGVTQVGGASVDTFNLITEET